MHNNNRPPSVKGKAAVIGTEQPNYSSSYSADAIVTALNLQPTGRGWVGTCPACNYPNALSVTECEGQVLWYCHACQDGKAVGRALQTFKQPIPKQLSGHLHTGSRKAARCVLPFVHSLWQQSRPAAGTVVSTYLSNRGLVGLIPPTLRFLPNCLHTPSGQYHPAMVAVVTCWPNRKPVAIHRTYLKPDGSGKIVHPQARMMLGLSKGGAVRLAPHGEQLGLAEGIETAHSVQQASGLPMWACLSTAGLQAVNVPDDVGEVIIFADHDPPGIAAAQKAAERMLCLGKRVRIALPPKAGEDFNDIIREVCDE